MAGGIAKWARLTFGMDLRKRIKDQGGTDQDIQIVLEEAPEFMNRIAFEFVDRARMIREDRECFRLLHDEVVIQIPALKRPTTEEIQQNWPGIRSIERDDSTEEAVTLRLATVLKSTEEIIHAGAYARRLVKLRTDGKLLGFQHRQWLLENQKEHPALMALVGKIYIDFPGIIPVDGCLTLPVVPYMCSYGGEFVDGWHWPSDSTHSSGRVAVSGK